MWALAVSFSVLFVCLFYLFHPFILCALFLSLYISFILSFFLSGHCAMINVGYCSVVRMMIRDPPMQILRQMILNVCFGSLLCVDIFVFVQLFSITWSHFPSCTACVFDFVQNVSECCAHAQPSDGPFSWGFYALKWQFHMKLKDFLSLKFEEMKFHHQPILINQFWAKIDARGKMNSIDLWYLNRFNEMIEIWTLKYEYSNISFVIFSARSAFCWISWII